VTKTTDDGLISQTSLCYFRCASTASALSDPRPRRGRTSIIPAAIMVLIKAPRPHPQGAVRKVLEAIWTQSRHVTQRYEIRGPQEAQLESLFHFTLPCIAPRSYEPSREISGPFVVDTAQQVSRDGQLLVAPLTEGCEQSVRTAEVCRRCLMGRHPVSGPGQSGGRR
jgi:hypothetical protein